MELRWLSYFVAVADAGTVTAAADVVRVAQPSLSRQLRGLEKELGVAVFERGQGRLRLSPAGRALLPYARDVLARADALRAAADLQARGRLTRLTIAAPTTTLTDVVSPFLVTLTPDDPVPAVFTSDGDAAEDTLRRGADLVITSDRPRPPLAYRPLPALPVWAYVPASHPRAADGAIVLPALVEEPLILLPPGHPARSVFDAALHADALGAPAATEASNGTVAQALAAAGRGIAVVSDDPRYGLVPLALTTRDGTPISVDLACAWDSRHPAASALADLAARIERYVVRTYLV